MKRATNKQPRVVHCAIRGKACVRVCVCVLHWAGSGSQSRARKLLGLAVAITAEAVLAVALDLAHQLVEGAIHIDPHLG